VFQVSPAAGETPGDGLWFVAEATDNHTVAVAASVPTTTSITLS
jgi:hypothetical protein